MKNDLNNVFNAYIPDDKQPDFEDPYGVEWRNGYNKALSHVRKYIPELVDDIINLTIEKIEKSEMVSPGQIKYLSELLRQD